MSEANCYTVAALPLSCAADKNPSGVEGRVYIGFRPDLASVTIGSNGEITDIALTSPLKLYKYVSKARMHKPSQAVIPGDKRNMFDHEIVLSLVAKTATERKSIELLAIAERMFCIYETVGGQLICAGIDVHPYKSAEIDDERGLKCTALKQTDGGANINDNNAFEVTLKGSFFGMQKTVEVDTTLALSIVELDAKC